MVKFLKKKNKNSNSFVEPDEIFLDSKNLQNFDQQQFEGRVEKPISKETFFSLGIFFLICTSIFTFRLWFLQIEKGVAYLERSKNNTLKKIVVFADRGIIYDRNKRELAWNKKTGDLLDKEKENNFPIRAYRTPGFSHLLGYVSSPALDTSGNYWQTKFLGKSGLEKEYGDFINGENGSKIVEINAYKKIQSESVIDFPKPGRDLVTTIDSRIQDKLFELVKNLAESQNFRGGAGILMDIHKGEIITATTFPEYNSEIISEGKDNETIKNYLLDKRKVFLNRVSSGLYAPGSVIKPLLALAALNENIIDPNKKILSTGSISIPNPYHPNQKTVFKDWKAHGWTNMKEAIAVSSDVYFYTIGGGFEGQKGIGITNIEKYARLFGLGEKTGVDLLGEKSGTIPSPQWKAKNFKNDPWRIGDTYHTSIGQYGFQVTPLEIIRAISAIANRGKLVTPHFILNDTFRENQINNIDFKKEHYEIIHEGMRGTVSYGTAGALNVPYVKVAAKTGTAQLGVNKDRINSWVAGFFPYENPKYAFTILLESASSSNNVGASIVMRQLLDWMSLNTPEYFR
jgi:penicillin-binding protein 2